MARTGRGGPPDHLGPPHSLLELHQPLLVLVALHEHTGHLHPREAAALCYGDLVLQGGHCRSAREGPASRSVRCPRRPAHTTLPLQAGLRIPTDPQANAVGRAYGESAHPRKGNLSRRSHDVLEEHNTVTFLTTPGPHGNPKCFQSALTGDAGPRGNHRKRGSREGPVSRTGGHKVPGGRWRFWQICVGSAICECWGRTQSALSSCVLGCYTLAQG